MTLEDDDQEQLNMKELPNKEDYQPNQEDDEDAYSDYETKKKIEKQNTVTTGISS